MLEKAAGAEASGPLRLLVPSYKDREHGRSLQDAEYFVFNAFPDVEEGLHGPGGDVALSQEDPLRAGVQLELDRERATKVAAGMDSAGAAGEQVSASALGRLADSESGESVSSGGFSRGKGVHMQWHDAEYYFLGRLMGACIRHQVMVPVSIAPSVFRFLVLQHVRREDLAVQDPKLERAFRALEMFGSRPEGQETKAGVDGATEVAPASGAGSSSDPSEQTLGLLETASNLVDLIVERVHDVPTGLHAAARHLQPGQVDSFVAVCVETAVRAAARPHRAFL